MSNARRADLVRKARAGLIPASDDIADEKRARMNSIGRIIRAAKTQLGTVTRVSDEHAITSVLADLQHFCGWKGLSFRKIHEASCALYFEDEADFRNITSPTADAPQEHSVPLE